MASLLLIYLACAPLGAMAAFRHLSKPPVSPRIPTDGGAKQGGRPKPLSLVDPPSIHPFLNRTRVLPLRARLVMVRPQWPGPRAVEAPRPRGRGAPR